MRTALVSFPALLAVAASSFGCGSPSEGDLYPTCETVTDQCVRGRGFDVCCSDRGCSWVSWDGSAFTSADYAWNYCGIPATDERTRLTNPSSSDSTTSNETRTPAGPLGDPTGDGSGTPPGSPAEGSDGTTDTGSSSSGGSSSSAPPEACYGSPVSCSARYTSGSCQQDYAGCFWEESYCGGAAYSCGYFTTASGCNTQGGCSWSYYTEDCRGAAWACHQRYQPGSCYDQYGCSWVEGGCFGSAGSCSGRSSPSSCNGVAGCYWQ